MMISAFMGSDARVFPPFPPCLYLLNIYPTLQCGMVMIASKRSIRREGIYLEEIQEA